MLLKMVKRNKTKKDILKSCLLCIFVLFLNGFGSHLTIRASIGSAPWDVLNIGLSKTLGILYGTASIIVSFSILAMDIGLKEPIGIAMIIDSITVGKSVDFFNWLDIIPVPTTLVGSVIMMFIGLFIIDYTSALYMYAALGCGARDTLLVGLTKRFKKVPIGLISIVMLGIVTLSGFLLGGPVGIGTLICAFCQGPILQLAFETLSLDATAIKHQNIKDSIKIILKK